MSEEEQGREPTECAECGHYYTLRENSEPTELCDACCQCAYDQQKETIQTLTAERDQAVADAAAMREALNLSQLWLCNCIPTCELEGPKPLPVVSKALALNSGKALLEKHKRIKEWLQHVLIIEDAHSQLASDEIEAIRRDLAK